MDTAYFKRNNLDKKQINEIDRMYRITEDDIYYLSAAVCHISLKNLIANEK